LLVLHVKEFGSTTRTHGSITFQDKDSFSLFITWKWWDFLLPQLLQLELLTTRLAIIKEREGIVATLSNFNLAAHQLLYSRAMLHCRDANKGGQGRLFKLNS
jgi:hypothetical protein